jgi:hypothetical protein
MSRRVNTGLTLLLFLGVSAMALAQVPDYSGRWDMSTTAALPNNGGTCMFEGVANVMQNGTDLTGTVVLMLVGGPAACPMEMMADLMGQIGTSGCVELGVLLGGQLGEASFSGCPGDVMNSLVGNFDVTAGPFGGGDGGWSAMLARQFVIEIPTLSIVGLAALAVLLLVLGALLLHRRHTVL